MTTLQTLARRLCAASTDTLPQSALSSARKCLLDLLGCAAMGRDNPSVRHAREWASEAFPTGKHRIWFSADTLSMPGAGFVNACAASILDLDDGHRAASGHPGAAVIPAVLAAAEKTSASMGEVLTAIVCGYEAGVQIARARVPYPNRSVASGRWTALAVAAGAGRLLRLSEEELAHAMGLAEAYAPNMLAADHAGFAGSDSKEGIPWSVIAGLSAVEQVAHRFHGYISALDNPAEYIPGAILNNTSDPWLIEGTYFKPYGCCRWIHAAIDAVLDMRRAGVDASAVESIEIATFARACSLANDPAPRSTIAGQFSIPFCVAVALVDGEEGLLPLRPQALTRGDILGVANRVSWRCDAELDQMFPAQVPARVTMRMRGKTMDSLVAVPLGDPACPMLASHFAAKFAARRSGGNTDDFSKMMALLLPESPPTQQEDDAALQAIGKFVAPA
ncbi:2-methylcitrate dehydratase PrpD [Bordetella sputigena]|uniref:MmgE/PrpD family protein n=1 Tax=Bordetella sputigena TaxID=1416810 RepID=UPI0039EEB423